MKRTTVRTLAVIGGAAAIIAGIAAVKSATASPSSPPDSDTTQSDVQAPPATDYWSPERMRSARPATPPEDG